MEMTASEIISSYKSAKYPAKQISVLAELNGTSPKKIKEVLGEDLNPNAKRGPGRPPAGDRKKTPVPDSVKTLVIERLETLDQMIQELEKEYKELSEFLKG